MDVSPCTGIKKKKVYFFADCPILFFFFNPALHKRINISAQLQDVENSSLQLQCILNGRYHVLWTQA